MNTYDQIEILKGQVAEQQKSIQEAYIRIKELIDSLEHEKEGKCKYCGKQ